MNNRLHISISFNDVILPVTDYDDGIKRVPLKMISDTIGLQWKSQRKKISPDSFIFRRLNAILDTDIGSRYPVLMINIDKVTTFLHSVNPDNVRLGDNINTADWLENKITEWDDVVSLYESGINPSSSLTSTSELAKLVNAREKATPEEKIAFTSLISEKLSNLGHPVKPVVNPQGKLKGI